jgi:hypothetical protein
MSCFWSTFGSADGLVGAITEAPSMPRARMKHAVQRNAAGTVNAPAQVEILRHVLAYRVLDHLGDLAQVLLPTRRRGPKAEVPLTASSFDEIDVLILAQIEPCRIGARSIGVVAMQVEHTGLCGRDRHSNFFARGEIGDNCLW